MLKLKQIIVFFGLLVFISAQIFAQDVTTCQNNEPDSTILPVAISWPDNRNKQPLDKKKLANHTAVESAAVAASSLGGCAVW